MELIRDGHRDAWSGVSSPSSDVVWDEPDSLWVGQPGRSMTERDRGVQPLAASIGRRSPTGYIKWRGRRLVSVISSPTFLQLHGRSPLETTRIARTSVTDAAEVLGRSMEVEWVKVAPQAT